MTPEKLESVLQTGIDRILDAAWKHGAASFAEVFEAIALIVYLQNVHQDWYNVQNSTTSEPWDGVS